MMAAMTYSVKVNGAQHDVDADADTPLLWVLRDSLGLTGTKYGCGVGQCGACTVLMNDMPLRACSLPISEVGDAEIVTIEAVATAEARAIQAAWIEHQVPQCGYCQSGQIMAASALLAEIAEPTDMDIDQAMTGNICRCATYGRIRAAIKAAAQSLKAHPA